MIDLKLNSDGDLAIEDLDLVLVEEDDQVAQNLLIRLRFFKGEWFLNVNDGIPYYQSILVKNPDGALVRSIFKEAILTTPDVTKLLSFTADLNVSPRQAEVDFTVATIFGDVSVSGGV